MTTVAAIGARVRDLRTRAGLSTTAVAERAGIDVAWLREIERGDASGISLNTLTGLASAVGVPVAVLLGEQPPPLHWPVDRVFWTQVRREVEQIQGVA